jgi:hypothetical protein
VDEFSPDCETSVYALGQQELGHILSMPRIKARTSRREWQESKAGLKAGIPFYSIHKTRIGELWTKTHNRGSVFLYSLPLIVRDD